MTFVLGPLDAHGRVPARQQTRVAAFLLSAHGAQARRLAAALPSHFNHPWQTELHMQFCREIEFLSLVARSTAWELDPMLPVLSMSWEFAWLPLGTNGAADSRQALLIDAAAFGHALHGAIRPAALLPKDASPADPFVQALHRIELESGRLIQAQTLLLRGPELALLKDAVSAAVEHRHAQFRELWSAMLGGLDLRQ